MHRPHVIASALYVLATASPPTHNNNTCIVHLTNARSIPCMMRARQLPCHHTPTNPIKPHPPPATPQYTRVYRVLTCKLLRSENIYRPGFRSHACTGRMAVYRTTGTAGPNFRFEILGKVATSDSGRADMATFLIRRWAPPAFSCEFTAQPWVGWGSGRSSNPRGARQFESLLGAARGLRTRVVVGLRWLAVDLPNPFASTFSRSSRWPG